MFALLLLSAVSGHTLGSTLKPLQEMSMEDAVLSLSKQVSMEEKFLLLRESVEEGKKIQELSEVIKRVEINCLEDKNELSSKLEQVLNKMSEIEKSSNEAMDDVSNSMLVEKNKLLLMDNHLLFEVHQLQKKEREMFEKIVNIENEVRRDRVTTDLLQSTWEKNMKDAVLSLSKQMEERQKELLADIKRVEINYLADKNEISSKLEHALNKMSEMEKSSNVAMEDVSNKLKDEKNQLLLMNNQFSTEVLEIQKRAHETFEKIVNVESEARVRTDLLQKQLNETANMTHYCLASQAQIQETMQKNIERLENSQSNLSIRMGYVENSFEMLKKDLDNVSNRIIMKLTVQNNTNDIGLLKEELSRIQNEAKCGVDFDNAGNNRGENFSTDLVWPWMAAVYTNDTYGTRHVCGGSVIHRHFVLTYAGCVITYGGAGLFVKLGLSNLKTGVHRQEYRVQSAHRHPHFGSFENYDYSIGLLELEEPISFGPFVRPLCLPPRETSQRELLFQPQSTAKAVYLREYLSSPQAASPTMLNLTLLSQEECRRKLEEKGWEKYHPSPELSFCAESSSTTCPYYGSPLMQSRLSEDGVRTWTQVGIRDFCDDKYVFSPRLGHLMAWVDATIASSSKQ